MTEFIEQVFSTIFGNNVILAAILISIVPIIEIKGAIPFSMSTSIWGSVALSFTQALFYSLIGSCLIVPILAVIYIPIINALKRSKLFKKLALKIEEKVNRSKNKIENNINKTITEQSTNETNEMAVVSNESNEKNTNENHEIVNGKDSLNKGLEKEDKIERNLLVLKDEILVEEKSSVFKRTQKYNKVFFIKLLSVFLFVCVPLPLTGVWTGTCVAVMLGLGFAWSCAVVILGNIVAGILVTLVASIPGFDSIYIVYAVLIFIAVLLLYSLIKNLINKRIKK